MAERSKEHRDWLDFLEDDDVAFLKRFILSSGSLKQVASEYGVSYPTVRLRLDRLIQKIQIIDEQSKGDEFEALLATMFSDGKLDLESFRKIREAYSEQKNKKHTE